MATTDILCPPDTCPVCLSKLKKCELGKPENCGHYFCLQCIFEWSKVIHFIIFDYNITIYIYTVYIRMSTLVLWIERYSTILKFLLV